MKTLVTASIAALGSFVLALPALAVDPPPGGGYPGQNTALGDFALEHLIIGVNNDDTAIGYGALNETTTGYDNTAVGDLAMSSNTTGYYNTACGSGALEFSTTSTANSAFGVSALGANLTGNMNTAVGRSALLNNGAGSSNTAVGFSAMPNSYGGSNNIAIGANAGSFVAGASNNIEIGNTGTSHDSSVIRIGTDQKNAFIARINGVTVPSGVSVVVNNKGQLGTVTSSARYKEAIKPMERASEALLKLEPVTFRYKKALDPDAIPQFGLVAEQVAKVDPDLVARDESGKPYTVRYEAVNAMLLNEFLKEHKKVEELAARLEQMQSAMEKQAAALQKVSARVEASQPAARVVSNE